MIGYEYHPAAELEYHEAIKYYAKIHGELALRFVEEVEAAVQRAREFPEVYGRIGIGLRHVVTRRFPFLIVYEVRPDRIFIWAVAHGSRAPGYWRERLS